MLRVRLSISSKHKLFPLRSCVFSTNLRCEVYPHHFSCVPQKLLNIKVFAVRSANGYVPHVVVFTFNTVFAVFLHNITFIGNAMANINTESHVFSHTGDR